jgi:NAD(P)-dependent dehydrogenase (short-subunit alcohol dehydrogenase family)
MSVRHRPIRAVVTGASSGIGLAITSALLARGDQVIGNARSREKLERVARELGAGSRFVPVPGDIADPATSERLFELAEAELGRVDLLVNNAGVFIAKPLADYGPRDVDALVDTNLRGFVYATQRAARHMESRGGGHIVSVTASLARAPVASVPASVPILIKAGVEAATRALALELAPKGILVSAVAPGIVDTPLYSADMHEFLRTLAPLGRMGTATEIADAVLYMASATFTTGVVLPVDGGMATGRW